jgi:hypothetical protein
VNEDLEKALEQRAEIVDVHPRANPCAIAGHDAILAPRSRPPEWDFQALRAHAMIVVRLPASGALAAGPLVWSSP